MASRSSLLRRMMAWLSGSMSRTYVLWGGPATGNRGISLRKGDYVIGAAVTPSNEARNKQRLERAAQKGLTNQVEAAI